MAPEGRGRAGASGLAAEVPVQRAGLAGAVVREAATSFLPRQVDPSAPSSDSTCGQVLTAETLTYYETEQQQQPETEQLGAPNRSTVAPSCRACS